VFVLSDERGHLESVCSDNWNIKNVSFTFLLIVLSQFQFHFLNLFWKYKVVEIKTINVQRSEDQ